MRSLFFCLAALAPASAWQNGRIAGRATTHPKFRGNARFAANEKAEGEGRSALVLGWFDAKENELELVKKIYKKRGYGDVTVAPSLIASVAKPRGWYRTVKEMSAQPEHPFSRKYDVVHVMSGGFLNLYLQLLGGARMDFDTLVLDSTPILPRPSSFTRFARAYMATMPAPFSLVPKLVPLWLHLGFVTLRWSFASAYVFVRYALSKVGAKLLAGKSPTAGALAGPLQIGSMAPKAVLGSYSHVVANCVETVFGGRPAGFRAIFVTNAADPYLKYRDVQDVMAKAKELGCVVQEVPVKTDHVKAVFRKPAAIFGSIDGNLPELAAAAAAAPAKASNPAATDPALVEALKERSKPPPEAAPKVPKPEAEAAPDPEK